ncbi:MAG: porin [Cytophagales bacterium]|jgi:hypothetical protein|nr:porin [Cytophagales bacterium]
MKKTLWAALAVSLALPAFGQVVNTATLDTSDVNAKGKITVGGYIDLYYGYDFNRPPSGDRPYFVSMGRHNEATVNLAFVDVKYTASRVRARFVPGFGTYMNANYAAEPGTLRNIVEGNVGVRLFRNKNIWLDAGVLGSPYTNESAISKDHLMYTRSFAPEYVPYYLSGVKLTLPLGEKVTAYLYGLNGWQVIQDNNAGKALGTQLEYRPGTKWLLNWNTYVGDERSEAAPQNRMRYFSDVYFIYNPDGRFSATGCVYGGVQNREANGSSTSATWWQANLTGRYRFTDQISLSGRIEWFDDPDNVQITPVTASDVRPLGFRSGSAGLCLNVKVTDNAMFRFEGRQFFSNTDVFQREGTAVRNSSLLISNLTVWF